jgi:hypothetical protein
MTTDEKEQKAAETAPAEKDPKDAAQDKLKTDGIPLGRYQHYKEPLYDVFALSVDEGTLELLVHYRSLAHGTAWTRTLRNFTEEIEVGDKKVPRFKKVADPAKGFWASLFGKS